jgi:hypothetical protein
MPKLMPLTLHVEPEAFGPTLEAVRKLRGVMKVDLDLDQPRKLNGAREPSKKFDQKAEDYILNLLAGGMPMGTKVLRKHFTDVGRKPGSTSSALNLLKKDALIAHDDSKNWVLTKKAKDRMRWRAAAAKKAAAKKPKAKK